MKSISRIYRYATTPVLAAALVIGAAGCADVITFSKQSQEKGLEYYAQGNYGDAAGAFRNSVRQDPRNYKSHYYLGQSQEQLKQYQKAIGSYKTALDTAKATVEGREDLVWRKEALDALARVVALSDDRQVEIDAMERKAASSQSPEDYLILAKTYRYLGDADTAIDAYNRAALLGSTEFEIQKEYGLYLESLGQTAKAEPVLRRAYSLNGTDQQVNDALRRLGIVPGPAIRDQSQLAKPVIPRGPIPEVRMPNEPKHRTPVPSGSTESVSAPRD